MTDNEWFAIVGEAVIFCALLIEALANKEFTFDELNYNLYTLNKEIFNQLNKETTAFFKFLHRTPDVDYKMKE